MKSGRAATVFNEINITPLTDIFLVLLIIMMVVAPLLEYRQIDLAVSSSTDSEPADSQDSKFMRVVIDASGQYTLDGKPVSAADLPTSLRELAKTKTDGLVIETNPDATFDAMARAMDAAEKAQVTHVTTAESGPPAAAAPAASPPAPKAGPKVPKRR